jgi:DNA-directed RNA polymerase subunit beta'
MKKVDLHAKIKIRIPIYQPDGSDKVEIIETTVGRVLFNEVVPREAGYINEVLTKKSLRDIIGNIFKASGTKTTADFLDDIKALGYKMAFKGGLSFNLDDVIIPKEKRSL